MKKSAFAQMIACSVLLIGGCAPGLYGQNAIPSPDAPPMSSVGAAAGLAQDPSAAKARKVLEAMVEALGGERWLNLDNSYTEGRIAAFYQGKPTGGTVRYWSWHTAEADRTDLTEKKKDKHDWVQIYSGQQCWEITFRGKKAIPPKNCEEAIRRHEHSIEQVVRVWMKQPGTILMDEGQSLAGRHLSDQVTVLNAQNEAVTIQVDADTHLPLRRSFTWRDPVYRDKNVDIEEYDDYHMIQGLPTPFTISRYENGDETQQRFVFKAAYNVNLPPGGFDPDEAARRFNK